jgi:hypothetical protein
LPMVRMELVKVCRLKRALLEGQMQESKIDMNKLVP